MKKLTNDEFISKLKATGKDVFTDDVYVNGRTEMDFYCSRGHHWPAKPHSMLYNGSGCPFCSGNKAIVGETDLWTTRPDIAKLLKNQDEGYVLKQNSNADTDFICPECRSTVRNKVVRVCRQGFSCSMCSDGISYPEKVMRYILKTLNINYIPQYRIGEKRYYYDFYLIDFNAIIETDGIQHKTGWSHDAQNFEYQKENDFNKKKYAMNHNITKYITIDCSESNIEFISKNILDSELSNMIDLSKVDWVQCDIDATSSLLIQVADLYQHDNSIEDIMDILKISRSTVQVYLRKAEKIGLIEWNRKNFTPVILLNTKERFESLKDAAIAYNIKKTSNISGVCSGKHKYCGLHPITKEPLVWRTPENFNPNEVIDFMSLYNPCTAKINNTK